MSVSKIWIGIDLGDARTGVAVSDATGTLACGIEVIREKILGNIAKRVAEIAAERRAEGVIIGLPLNMDGTEGPRCDRSRFFASLLGKRIDIPIILRDERLTTVEAHSILSDLGRKDRRKKIVDALAAEIILQGFLDE